LNIVPDAPPDIFDHHIDFDPTGDFEQFLRAVPAKWVVYLMCDAQNRPVQLLCVKNLRYSLKRRLGSDEPDAPRSKRVNYRELVRKVHWRRVECAFEADLIYLEAARASFPQTYRGMTGFRPAWFVHVDPDAPFPRYAKTIDLSPRPGVLIGPIEDKNAAGKLIEDVADWFDLCRYYNILLESPRARPCAYKEMGKCPAPCDGTISMDHYRALVEWSANAIVAPDALIRDNTRRMQKAAAELRFESAARIKAYVDSLSQLGKGSLRHMRLLRDFNFIALQRGPRQGTAKVFLVAPGMVEEMAGLVAEPNGSGELLRLALPRAQFMRCDGVDPIGAERIGVVAHHLFQAKSSQGVFIPLEIADEKSLARGFRELLKQKPSEDAGDGEADDEGVTKELQAM
jgi:excinuclease UvrABC nuclease subunit